jgi:hypothetical protein
VLVFATSPFPDSEVSPDLTMVCVTELARSTPCSPTTLVEFQIEQIPRGFAGWTRWPEGGAPRKSPTPGRPLHPFVGCRICGIGRPADSDGLLHADSLPRRRHTWLAGALRGSRALREHGSGISDGGAVRDPVERHRGGRKHNGHRVHGARKSPAVSGGEPVAARFFDQLRQWPDAGEQRDVRARTGRRPRRSL